MSDHTIGAEPLKTEIAELLVAEYEHLARPQAETPEGLYLPKAILRLDDNRRCWMGAARADDLAAWASLVAAETAAAVREQAAIAEYVALRLAVMREHPDLTLDEVERTFFGFDAEGVDA